jgi:HAD superfamily hydrolase (TIGR01509 family)
MPRRFDAVVFDWYATLASPDPDDWWPTIWERLEQAGAVVPDEARMTWTTPPIAHPDASLDEATYRRYEASLLAELLAASGLGPEQAEGIERELTELRDAERIGIYPDVEELLGELRDAGTVVALCSNWSWDLDRHLDANGITHRFDTIICSAIVGYRKPHPAIFELLLRELDLPADRVAFVGDDWAADIEGAAAAGLTTFHLAREQCTVTSHLDVPCASDLVELRSLLL